MHTCTYEYKANRLGFDNQFGALPLKKTDSPFLSSHLLPEALGNYLGIGIVVPPPQSMLAHQLVVV